MTNTLEPWYGDQSSVAPAVQPTKDGSKFQNIASGIANLFNSASNVITSVKSPAPGTPGYNPAIVNSPATMAPGTTTNESKPNYLKMGLIGLAIAGLGYGGYKLATRKKKSLSGVGDITAKTKSGKRKQTKAIFARLAEEGTSKPKRKARRKRSTRKVKL